MQIKFNGWNNVPFDYKTQKSWKYKFKNIVENEYSKAEVEFLVGDNPPKFITVPLYHISQTVDFIPTRKEIAFEEFWQIFCSKMDQHRHINRPKGDDGWRVRNTDNFKFKNIFDRDKLESHLDQNLPRGVFPKNNDPLSKTKFVIIDLDLHNKDKAIFLQMLKVLLDIFWGRGKCFIGLNPKTVNGIHLILVFDNPKNVLKITDKIKAILKTLDIRNEKLTNHALSSGMNSFSAIEVFPRNDRGVRLPMGKGYTVITDHIITNVPVRVKKRTRLVADFVSLIDWLEDPNRKHMDKEGVISFIADKLADSLINLKLNTQKKTSAKKAVPSEFKTNSSIKESNNNALNAPKNLKGNFFEILYKFWVSGEPLQEKDGNCLNKQVLYLAKLAREFDYNKDAVVSGILRLLGELPQKSKAVSRRLLINDPDTLKSDVSRIVENVFKNPVRSEMINAGKEFKKHKKFDPLDTKTWCYSKKRKTNLVWTTVDRKIFYKVLSPILNVKNINTILKFVKEFINLVELKIYQNKGIGPYYLRDYWAPSYFPKIKLGHYPKVCSICPALVNLGIIKVGPAGIGNIMRGCTKYELGVKALAAMV